MFKSKNKGSCLYIDGTCPKFEVLEWL